MSSVKKRHNGPKALSALTNSMPLVQSRNFNKFGNLGQNSACFCLAKGQEYMLRMAADVSIAIAVAKNYKHENYLFEDLYF